LHVTKDSVISNLAPNSNKDTF